MAMIGMVFAGAMLAGGIVGDPQNVASATGAFRPAIVFSRPKAVVYSGGWVPLFSGTPEFIFGHASNPRRVAYAWDRSAKRVRITPEDAPHALWLRCDAVMSAPGLCESNGEPVRSGDDGSEGTQSFEPHAPSALPDCPGDVRCPR